MKTINRIALGTMSSLLHTAGLNRVAEKFDPLSKTLSSIKSTSMDAVSLPANTCAAPCFFQME
jgi:hypothetical protein